MMNSKQQIFDFGVSNHEESHFIVSSCNIDAYNLIHSFSYPGIAVIVGEEGCGKTTLLNMWIAMHSALNLTDIRDPDVYKAAHFIAIDDLELLYDEETLFYLLNHCLINKVSLLITASYIPKYVREDLNSRINAALKCAVRSPDDEIMRILLKRYFTMEQAKVSDETIDFLVRRIDSRFSALWKVCESLNVESFKAMRPINRGIASEILKK